MKQNSYTLAILLFFTILTSCNNINHKREERISKLKMVDIPTIYSSPQEIETYIVNHFWDTMNFSDSAYLEDKAAIRLHYTNYINNLLGSSHKTAQKSFEKFTDSVLSATPPLKEYLLEIIELSLYDPNSKLRNESFYITFLKRVVNNPNFNPYLKERYREQLELALKNRVGNIANDFTFTTISGEKGRLHTLPKKATLIMFYEPDCPACESSLAYLNNSDIMEHASKHYNMIAVYTGDNLKEWAESAVKFKPYWIIAHDSNMIITEKRLYDRRPSPSFYLIDKNRVVLLKDALADEVLYNISSALETK